MKVHLNMFEERRTGLSYNIQETKKKDKDREKKSSVMVGV